MEQHNHPDNGQPASRKNPLRDLEPGRPDRNLLSNSRDEAPIDKDRNIDTDEGDENYADEELNDPDYFEKRAGDNVRK